MSMLPLISVIIPVYNCQAYLKEAIESVFRQTWENKELIIIDDGSTDDSARIARSYGGALTYHFQENKGLGAARNAGIERSNGRLVAFLDADDVWLPEKLALQVAALHANPDTSMAFTMLEQFVSPELCAQVRERLKGDGQIMAGYSGATMLIWKEALKQAGKFPTHIQMGEFIDWYARAVESGLKSVLLKDVLMRRRIHGENMSLKLKESRREYLRVLKDSLDRRRNA